MYFLGQVSNRIAGAGELRQVLALGIEHGSQRDHLRVAEDREQTTHLVVTLALVELDIEIQMAQLAQVSYLLVVLIEQIENDLRLLLTDDDLRARLTCRCALVLVK